MGIFSTDMLSQVRNLMSRRRPERATSADMPHSDAAASEYGIGVAVPEDGYRPVSEFDGKMLEALFTEAGGGMGGGGNLEMEADARRNGGEGTRNWGANYNAAASAVASVDVRTLATRSAMAIGVASGDFSADGLFDQDNADGWSELLQSAGAAHEGAGFAAGFSDQSGSDWLEEVQADSSFPNLRGHGLLPDLTDAIEGNDGLRQRVADFVTSGQGGTDAGFLTAVEREVTSILYGWAGLDDGGATDAGPEMRQARFLDSYFGTQTSVGIAEVLPPEAISDMFNEVRDAAILKLAGQGPVAGLFRDLAYDAGTDRLTGSAAMDRGTLNAFGSSAATLGPEREAGAWQALADLTHGFESVLGSTGALPTLFAAVCERGAGLAGRVGEGLRTLGIDPGSLKVKLPGLDGDEDGEENGEDGFESGDAGDAGSFQADEASESFTTAPDWAEEPDTGVSTLDWNTHAARQDWSALPGGATGGMGFGNLFDDYAVGASSPSQGYGQNSAQQQGADLFQMPVITGFSIFDCLLPPAFQVV
jgi:hypothetical protein